MSKPPPPASLPASGADPALTSTRVNFHQTGRPGVDAMTATTAQTFPRHTHDQYGIGLIDTGAQASASDSRQVEAGPGNIILVNPGEVHDGRPLGGRARSWRMLYLDPRLVAQWHADIAQAEDSNFAFFAPVIADPAMRETFNRAFAAAISPEIRTPAFEGATLDLIAQMAARLGRHRPRAEGPRKPLRQARELIDSNPSQPFSLVTLSHETGLSRYQLHRGFLREFGLSPHAYIMQQRVALARRLIRAGESLAQAAAAAGFCDQSHLNRVFVRQFGLPPGQYALPVV